MRRFTMICAVLFAFILTTPAALAADGDDTKVETKDTDGSEAKADVTNASADADAKAEANETDGAAEVSTDEDLADKAVDVLEAARSHEWALMLSGIIMLILAGLRKFKLMEKLPNAALPWVSVVLGVLAVVGDNLATGGAITASRLLQGVMAGMAASGAWGMIGKHLPFLSK